jgi:hypothetical protein
MWMLNNEKLTPRELATKLNNQAVVSALDGYGTMTVERRS